MPSFEQSQTCKQLTVLQLGQEHTIRDHLEMAFIVEARGSARSSSSLGRLLKSRCYVRGLFNLDSVNTSNVGLLSSLKIHLPADFEP